MATHALVILSPTAPKGVRDSVQESLEARFGAAGLAYEILEPPAGRPFGTVVRSRLADGFDLVVAAGGDGTVSAVVDGLAGSGVPLGIVPIGTANLVARELNVPLEIDDAVSLAARAPNTRMLDAMRIGGRVYVLVLGVGISASVAGGVTRRSKRRLGVTAYLHAAVGKAFEFKQRHLEVEVDGVAQKYRALEVTVANCGILARMLFPKGPDIRVDDGHLDVWILSTKTVLDYPRYLFGVLAGRRTNPRIHALAASRKIVVRSSPPLPVQADGDVIGTTPVEIDVMPGAVRVIVPERAAVEPERGLVRDVFMTQYLANLAKRPPKK